MNALEEMLRQLHDGERRLADELVAVSVRHDDEHEICHVARDLARWSQEHAQRLADFCSGRGLDVTKRRRRAAHTPALAAGGKRDRKTEPGLAVLHDLRALYLLASDNSLMWEILAQAAQARRDSDLLHLASDCHPETLRQIRWANTQLKTTSPQLISSLNSP